MTSPSDRKGDWMQTYTGRQFWPLDPRPEEVFIEDIAHHLSMECRYCGACEWHYSVAQHSVYVSHRVPGSLALEGLLHDAAEAYCKDIHRPLKRSLSEYHAVELRIADVIAERFHVDSSLFDVGAVHHADYAVGEAEKRQIMKATALPWEPYGHAAPIVISEWSPKEAETEFLRRFRELARVR